MKLFLKRNFSTGINRLFYSRGGSTHYLGEVPSEMDKQSLKALEKKMFQAIADSLVDNLKFPAPVQKETELERSVREKAESTGCKYTDPRKSVSGYAEWCLCMGGRPIYGSNPSCKK